VASIRYLAGGRKRSETAKAENELLSEDATSTLRLATT